MNEWKDFFIATAGASAALTGLIFVGVSISLNKILSHPGLPNRALISLVLLLSILIFSLLLLMPRTSLQFNGWELIILGIFHWLFLTGKDIYSYRKTEKQFKRLYLINMALDQLSSVPYMVSGVLLMIKVETALYWVAVAIIFSFIKAVLDAWVLLVEINR